MVLEENKRNKLLLPLVTNNKMGCSYCKVLFESGMLGIMAKVAGCLLNTLLENHFFNSNITELYE